ncbi:uncharacterized protein GGS22DRAFT_162555 [Annulohypoxylon maeteangense]|uniref:uncharacterized protein n=1 Tax=Annulohypoxylon maeteangense TaxID=1927788 RepID=UPI0020083534|nr:uncharacterized protein GGS22DRAFT_162555 [Annulohypoxylon maeteangense]KAI0885034.1 hypothetical protein GGS22DRAFT_162555 [Annulohypoxylon maeteangense]
MANPEPTPTLQERIEGWGNSSLAPTGLATLITALHFRPFQVRPMLFVPILLFSSYSNLQGFKMDSAGMTAAASGTYALVAMRRRPVKFMSRFSIRGIVRGAAVGLGIVNAVAASWVYINGDREKEKDERKNNPRWV